MGIEIERKFLVKDDSWKAAADQGRVCRQGYLLSDGGMTVRIRVIGETAFLTIKGPTNGFSRKEFEYEIPAADAEALLALCGNRVEKVRYLVSYAGMVWELDVFAGANEGLLMAEIELESEGQKFEFPEWVGEEVSGDSRYYNAYLATHPFTGWH
jgi:adenylate cyclase